MLETWKEDHRHAMLRPGHSFYEVPDGPEAVVARLAELPVIEDRTAASRL